MRKISGGLLEYFEVVCMSAFEIMSVSKGSQSLTGIAWPWYRSNSAMRTVVMTASYLEIFVSTTVRTTQTARIVGGPGSPLGSDRTFDTS